MPATTKTKPSSPPAKPVGDVRAGGVRIPIWRNDGEDGPRFRAGLPEFSYRTQDGEWREMSGLTTRDLVNLIKAASLAHSEILKGYRETTADPAQATEEVA
jgi:hypothetical protein